MEFWGAEIKSGQTFDVVIGEGKVLHLSQACLGESKKETKESVCMQMTVDGKKLVLGTLIPEKIPQQLFDLVFDRNFQVSHNSKNGSIYLYGYKADNPADDHDDSEEFSSEDEEEELPLPVANGKQEAKKEEKKVVVPKKELNAKASAAGKQKVKIVEPEKDEKDSDDDDDDSDDSDAMSEESDDDEDNEDSSDDEEDSDEEETPKKEQSGKKRQNESASKTPTDKKKAKIAATPQKTEGKKGGAVHIATPHPSKQAVAKTPAGGSKSNQKSPATDGAHSCKSCNRNFKSEGALSSHNQAKHTASK